MDKMWVGIVMKQITYPDNIPCLFLRMALRTAHCGMLYGTFIVQSSAKMSHKTVRKTYIFSFPELYNVHIIRSLMSVGEFVRHTALSTFAKCQLAFSFPAPETLIIFSSNIHSTFHHVCLHCCAWHIPPKCLGQHWTILEYYDLNIWMDNSQSFQEKNNGK